MEDIKETIINSGKSIILRDTLPSDVEAYLRWKTSGRWRHYDAPWEGVLDKLNPENEKNYRETFLENRKKAKPFPLVTATIATIDHNIPLGWVTRYNKRPKHTPNSWYLGIDICEDNYLEKGLGTEALKLWIDYLFSFPQFHRLGLDTWSFNPRMMHVAEKVGFIYEGAEREMLEWEGKRLDLVHFGLLKEEWKQR